MEVIPTFSLHGECLFASTSSITIRYKYIYRSSIDINLICEVYLISSCFILSEHCGEYNILLISGIVCEQYFPLETCYAVARLYIYDTYNDKVSTTVTCIGTCEYTHNLRSVQLNVTHNGITCLKLYRCIENIILLSQLYFKNVFLWHGIKYCNNIIGTWFTLYLQLKYVYFWNFALKTSYAYKNFLN